MANSVILLSSMLGSVYLCSVSLQALNNMTQYDKNWLNKIFIFTLNTGTFATSGYFFIRACLKHT